RLRGSHGGTLADGYDDRSQLSVIATGSLYAVPSRATSSYSPGSSRSPAGSVPSQRPLARPFHTIQCELANVGGSSRTSWPARSVHARDDHSRPAPLLRRRYSSRWSGPTSRTHVRPESFWIRIVNWMLVPAGKEVCSASAVINISSSLHRSPSSVCTG